MGAQVPWTEAHDELLVRVIERWLETLHPEHGANCVECDQAIASPTWSPDNGRIAFGRNSGAQGGPGMFIVNAVRQA